jgi:hypothetical protein
MTAARRGVSGMRLVIRLALYGCSGTRSASIFEYILAQNGPYYQLDDFCFKKLEVQRL